MPLGFLPRPLRGRFGVRGAAGAQPILFAVPRGRLLVLRGRGGGLKTLPGVCDMGHFYILAEDGTPNL